MSNSALSVTSFLGFPASLGKLPTCLCPGAVGLDVLESAALESAALAGGRCILGQGGSRSFLGLLQLLRHYESGWWRTAKFGARLLIMLWNSQLPQPPCPAVAHISAGLCRAE